MTTVESVLMQKGSDIIGTVPETSVREAVHKMAEANVGSLFVEEDVKIVGIFTERDLLRRVVDECRDPDTMSIREVMSAPVHTCKASDGMESCSAILAANSFRHLVVMDNDEPVGVFSLRDLVHLPAKVT